MNGNSDHPEVWYLSDIRTGTPDVPESKWYRYDDSYLLTDEYCTLKIVYNIEPVDPKNTEEYLIRLWNLAEYTGDEFDSEYATYLSEDAETHRISQYAVERMQKLEEREVFKKHIQWKIYITLYPLSEAALIIYRNLRHPYNLAKNVKRGLWIITHPRQYRLERIMNEAFKEAVIKSYDELIFYGDRGRNPDINDIMSSAPNNPSLKN